MAINVENTPDHMTSSGIAGSEVTPISRLASESITERRFSDEVNEELPLLAPGEYELMFIGHVTGVKFVSKLSVQMDFKVLTPGRGFDCVLSGYYNAVQLGKKRGKNGSFKVGTKSDLFREFHAVIPGKHRSDRLPMSRLNHIVIVGEVATVTHDRRQQPLTENCQYSKVARMLRPI